MEITTKGAGMKRIETLVKEAKAHLDATAYRDGSKNGIDALTIARAVDEIARAEKTLRAAFGSATR